MMATSNFGIRNKNSQLGLSSVTSLHLQRFLGRLFVVPICLIIIGLFRFYGRYTVVNLGRIRSQFKEIASKNNRIVVCANHLTLIDSVIMIWAFGSPFRYLINYRLFCWNLPAVENTVKRVSWRVVTFLSKCLLVNRMGDSAHTDGIIKKICYLLSIRDILMIFPEGTRSRSGRLDPEAVNYGVGKILQEVSDCKVLCVYMRGRGQEKYSDFPRKGETIDISMELIEPKSDKSGLRGAKDLSLQVISKLKEMEERHFSSTQ